MRQCVVVVLLVLSAMVTTCAGAAELVVFERAGCPWCVRWEDEVGGVYGKTAEGRRAPLRRVDVARGMPDDLKQIKPVVFTPTFVLVEDGQEVGRIEGYSDNAFFYAYLEGLIGKLKPLPATN